MILFIGTCLFLCNFINIPVFVVCQQDPNNIDQLLKELNILTRQQLEPPPSMSTTTESAVKAVTKAPKAEQQKAAPTKVKLEASGSQKTLQLSSSYDPNKLPKFSRSKPLVVGVNMTVLHVTLDKQESVITLDLEMKECWKDKRLRVKRDKKGKEDSDQDDLNDEDEEGEHEQTRKTESYLLDSEWSTRIWHPISRMLNNGEVKTVSTLSYSSAANISRQGKLKTIEQEDLIENIYVLANETNAQVWLSLRLRLNIPVYECKRDDSSLYPFDKIKCWFSFANALHDKRSLIYKWDNINWQHTRYHTGEFYLLDLSRSIESEPILDLDKDSSEHSTMRVEFVLKRQIGDYVLNVYLLHIFLLALCVASFWISINNIVIRMSLSIIVLIIIKFQTVQTLKDDRHIVSALSIWTFGLSGLVVLSLLCHILSYYSTQHKWNDKILNQLIKHKGNHHASEGKSNAKSERLHKSVALPTGVPEDASEIRVEPFNTANNLDNPGDKTPQLERGLNSTRSMADSRDSNRYQLREQWSKAKQNCLTWLNSIILKHSRKDEGYDKINFVDIISRVVLLIIYLAFVLVYFCHGNLCSHIMTTHHYDRRTYECIGDNIRTCSICCVTIKFKHVNLCGKCKKQSK